MGQVIDFWGGGQIYLSGVRSFDQQDILFRQKRVRPVAAPGCSQHQYGFAVDVSWLPIIDFAANIQLTGKQTDDIMIDLGRQLGLVTVPGDPGHFQVFPGSEFRTWAVASGFCDPNLRIEREELELRSFLGKLFVRERDEEQLRANIERGFINP